MAKTDDLEEPLEFANYQLTARLDRGRMGNVYRAKSHGVEGFEKIVCVKVIDPELAAAPGFVDTLIEEAKRTVSLSHANVAQVYDLGHEETRQRYYLVSEFVQGFDLRRARSVARDSDRDWPRDLSLYIASETAKALDYAHRRKDFNFNSLNLLHRDLHPSNILISFDGGVKVTDFGISRAMEATPPDREPVSERRFIYSPPEYVHDRTYTRESDLFGLGLILFEMLAGFHPYRRDDRPVREAARHPDLPPLGELVDAPRNLQHLVDSMLATDPAGRPSSAGSVYEELVDFLFTNNLRADDRSLSLLLEELREAEPDSRADSDRTDSEQISRSDVRNFYDQSSASLDPPAEASSSRQSTPRASGRGDRRSEGADPENSPSESPPELPGELESCFESARQGDGRTVLMYGHFGRGPRYLPDRISEALEWRANARALDLHVTPDDLYRPFGVLSDAFVRFLTDRRPDDRAARRRTLERLEQMGASRDGTELLRALWGRTEHPSWSPERRRRELARLLVTVLRETSEQRPVVLVVDRVERADTITMDALRDAVGAVARLPVMVVLATSDDELIRTTLDAGPPESLRALRISAPRSGGLDGIPDLSTDASRVLLSLAISERPLRRSTLSDLLDGSEQRIDEAAAELSEAGLVRTPTSQTLLTALAEASVWVEERFEPEVVARTTRALASHFTERARDLEGPRWEPTRIRLHAAARQRRRTLRTARQYGDWLESNGWFETALELYDFCSDRLTQEAVGSPNPRIQSLLSRAELALDLSRLDRARSSLEPLHALSETVRNERALVRSQLLFGRMALRRDQIDEAREFLERATAIARGLRRAGLLAVSLAERAARADRLGHLLHARRLIRRARNLAQRRPASRDDEDLLARILGEAVRIHGQFEVRQPARDALEELESLASATDTASARSRTRLGEAELLARRDRHDEALEHLREGYEIARNLGKTALTIPLLRRRAAIALRAQRLGLVDSLTEQLIELASRHDELYSEQRGRDIRAAGAAMDQRDTTSAISLLRTSLDRARRREIPRDLVHAHEYLARALDALGSDEADEHRERARTVEARMRNRRAID